MLRVCWLANFGIFLVVLSNLDVDRYHRQDKILIFERFFQRFHEKNSIKFQTTGYRRRLLVSAFFFLSKKIESNWIFKAVICFLLLSWHCCWSFVNILLDDIFYTSSKLEFYTSDDFIFRFLFKYNLYINTNVDRLYWKYILTIN